MILTIHQDVQAPEGKAPNLIATLSRKQLKEALSKDSWLCLKGQYYKKICQNGNIEKYYFKDA